MPVQHTEDENQSSWWIIELGANLQWGCVYTKPNIQSSQPKKKKKEFSDRKNKISWSGLCRQNKMRNQIQCHGQRPSRLYKIKREYVRVRLLMLTVRKIDSAILRGVIRSFLLFLFHFKNSNLRWNSREKQSHYPKIWVMH